MTPEEEVCISSLDSADITTAITAANGSLIDNNSKESCTITTEEEAHVNSLLLICDCETFGDKRYFNIYLTKSPDRSVNIRDESIIHNKSVPIEI